MSIFVLRNRRTQFEENRRLLVCESTDCVGFEHMGACGCDACARMQTPRGDAPDANDESNTSPRSVHIISRLVGYLSCANCIHTHANALE